MRDDTLLHGRPILVLDLETDALIPKDRDLSQLTITIGAAWDYATMQLQWFDTAMLAHWLSVWTAPPRLLVTYNGLGFDLPILSRLFRAVLQDATSPVLMETYVTWQRMVAQSWDLLALCWAADPASRYIRGLHRFSALCAANGLGGKQAPQDDMPALWQAGQIAAVLNHCQEDVLLLRDLFALGYQTGGHYQRLTSPVTVAMPALVHWPVLEKRHAAYA